MFRRYLSIEKLDSIRSVLFDNITVRQTVLKNTFWLTVGIGISKLTNFVLLVFAARVLGVTEYGKFTFALAFVALLTICGDLGISPILIREFSKEKERESDFHALLSLKIFLVVGMIMIISLGSFFVTSSFGIRKIIMILAFYAAVNSVINLNVAFFQARQKMEYQAFGEIVAASTMIILGFIVLLIWPSAENLSYIFFLSVLFTLVFITTLLHQKITLFKVRWDIHIWKKYLSMSWPLAFTGFLTLIYSYIDSVMLGYKGMIIETGWYNAAYRIAAFGFLISSPICGSFYPVLSEYFKKSKAGLQKIWEHFSELMIILGIPLTTGGMFLAPRIICFFYGDNFTPSILAFQLLIITTGIIFLYTSFQQILIVSGQQKKIFCAILGGAILNIIMNLILIPKFSLYGAAIATVITHFLILSLLVIFTVVFTPVRVFFIKFLTVFIGVIVSSGLMLLIISRPFIYNLSLIFAVLIGIISYFVSIFFYRKLIKLIIEND